MTTGVVAMGREAFVRQRHRLEEENRTLSVALRSRAGRGVAGEHAAATRAGLGTRDAFRSRSSASHTASRG